MIVRFILVSAILLLSASVAASQAVNRTPPGVKPDLSGVWIPESEKMSKPEAGPHAWTNVIIEQHDTQVKFRLVYPPEAKPPAREFIYFTDQRGETNSGTVYFFFVANNKLADDEVKSKTTWDGSALVVVHQLMVHAGPLTANIELTMRWSVSDDGKTLVRTVGSVTKSATYLQKTAEGEKLYPLAVPKEKMADSKDVYLRLEAKQEK
jgi:hypothetical protein